MNYERKKWPDPLRLIRRGVFQSVPDLITALETYLTANNTNPKPFIWTATAEQILTKVRRVRGTLDAVTNQNPDTALDRERRAPVTTRSSHPHESGES